VSAAAVALLLAAALLHSLWNLLVKSARDPAIFGGCALAAGALAFSPLLASAPSLPARVLPWLAASAAAEAVYFVALAEAYRRADFSLAYPLARGSAPALLAGGSILWLGERPSPAGAAGLAILVAGLVVTGGAGIRSPERRRAARRGIAPALAVGACIATYSLLDGAAMRWAPPAPYLAAVMALSAALVLPVLWLRRGRAAFAAELAGRGGRVALAGVLMLAAYGLVLAAYARAPVAYAGAVREVSVVFGALAGWRLLGEPFGPWSLAGSALVAVGAGLIAAGG
jgi:drug/metabolite transporter (DMT)-like permease